MRYLSVHHCILQKILGEGEWREFECVFCVCFYAKVHFLDEFKIHIYCKLVMQFGTHAGIGLISVSIHSGHDLVSVWVVLTTRPAYGMVILYGRSGLKILFYCNNFGLYRDLHILGMCVPTPHVKNMLLGNKYCMHVMLLCDIPH